ncbi:acid--CoA ligase [Camelimonas fluminis]|uniref:Long-chain fatty acid--CoA ligase n=1 Tax=Camelimonas fluminis TaxID=1576911 RepID=A0ABV7ULN3_9HYPH|nr:long-chain fatty acid--CoA ligase [Camelimonas fluminis]GHE61271.1 acid--CoA ligase [Camelimonas fluminis]
MGLGDKRNSSGGSDTPRAWKDIDDCQVSDWIASNASYFPHKIATVDLHSGRRHTYSQMHERVARVAGLLQAWGVGKGDRVAVLSMNSTDMLDIQYGCWRVGAIYLPLNFRLTASELTFIVNDASPEVMFFDETFAATVAELRSTTGVAHWTGMDGRGGASEFETALAAATPVCQMVDLKPADLCMIMYSSGTTGLPKGVTFNYAMTNAFVLNTAPGFLASHDMVGLSVMPLFHIGGTNAFSVTTLFLGGTTIIMRAFDPGEALDVFNDPELGVTHFLGVPAIFNALKEHPKNAATDFSRLRYTVAGAETIPEELVHWWHKRGLVIQELYGMTESGGAVCVLAPHDIPRMIGAAGQAQRHCRIQITRGDGSQADPDELGEIWLRGATVTSGYWNRPEANDEAFVDGWFRSGDIGRMDADGYVYVEDRLKDMYISGGENVYPAEIENVLYGMPEIAELAVIGVPDDRWGEVGCAVVVPRPGQEVTIDAIRARCDGRLARFKQPVHLVEMESLPRNPTGKVLKFQLRKMARDMLAG